MREQYKQCGAIEWINYKSDRTNEQANSPAYTSRFLAVLKQGAKLLTLSVGVDIVKEGGEPGEENVETIGGDDVTNDESPNGGMSQQ